MKKEAASAGVLDTPFGKFARLQILTIEDLFAGKKPAMPPEDPAAFKRAAREEDKTLNYHYRRLEGAIWEIPVRTSRRDN